MANKKSGTTVKKTTTEMPEELTLVHIPLSKIVRDPRNPRNNIPEKDIEEMAETIREHGVISPISVRIDPKKKDQHIIIYGQCRFDSSRRAEKETVPCLIRNIDADTALEWMHIENLQRHALDPVDEAESLAVLKGRKMSIADISAKIGKNPTWVAQRLKIADLSENVKYLIHDEKITVRQAEEISKLDSKDEQYEVASLSARLKYSFEQTKREVESRMMSLGKVQWLLTAEYVDIDGDTMIPCSHCKSRTGCQGELFGEVSSKDDRWLNKQCYERKRAAFVQSEIERLKSEKKKVVPAQKVDSVLSPYAKSKEDILAAKAAKVKPEFVVDPNSGKVREVYKKAKDSAGSTERKIQPWEIENKANELAKDYLVELAENECKMTAIMFVGLTKFEQNINENISRSRMDKMIQLMFENFMENFDANEAQELLRRLEAKPFDKFLAQSKVELGVITKEDGKNDGPESED